jgi:branched-subunit amino acid transport protein
VTAYTDTQIWLLIALLGVATYIVRFSFLGLLGDRDMPKWLLRHLRYTAVAVLPGLVAPLVLWPAAAGGSIDPVRLTAAGMTLLIGWWRKSLIAGAVAGVATLALLMLLS